jgi:hypothetical protein
MVLFYFSNGANENEADWASPLQVAQEAKKRGEASLSLSLTDLK